QSSVSSPPASGEKAGWVVKNDSGESDAINRPQIAIEAKVFTAKVTHAQVAEQLKAAGVAVELNSMGLFASAALTDEQSSVFEKWMASLAGTSALVCPKVRVFDGEKTRMALNDTQKFTTGYEGDTPKVDEFTTGVTFEFTPTYQKQDDAIRLTLAFDKKMIIDIMKQTDDAGRETEMPGFGTKSVHTTVEIPQGKTMLVPVAGSGGMGGMGSPELKAEQIFLLIKTELETQSSVSRPQSSGENVKEIQTQIEILENCKSGEREKWFAAVKALADIGSPAVPALSDAIRKTNRPRAQSTMALTLRAIGDPQAVPALIDALEKSGFSSDYGIGDPDTELAKFIHKHQMDPSKESITLGRPVREITISLERLTGHTEGHDHFHAYDENGRRLGSYTVTPEIRDREKEHRKQVAQRWRSWWQNLQKSRAHEGGVIAGHKGSVLEFYVLPEPDKEDWAGLTPDDVAQYRGGLQTEGPWAGSIRGDSYQWALIKDDFQDNDLIVETYQGERYADRFEGRVL
ncbi:MAG: HEAT repeat domain-containing protein, partial [Planctomycetota bacterium]